MRKYPITLHVYPEVTLKRVIEGVEDLIAYYQNPRAYRFNAGNCPLCDYFDCKGCLWDIFHHMGCEAFCTKRFDMGIAEAKKMKEWRVLRVTELKYWLRELKRPGVKMIEDA